MNETEFIVLGVLYHKNQREPVRFDELISPIYDTYLMNVSILKAVLERLEHKGYVHIDLVTDTVFTFLNGSATTLITYESYTVSITFAGLWYHHLYKKKTNIL